MGRPGLAKQLLAGDEGLFIGIFPEIAKDEAAFLIPDLREHLAQRPGFLEAGKHLAITSCHSRSDSFMSDLLLYFAVM